MVGVRRHVGGGRPGGGGGVKTPPYGMSHKRDMVVSGGPGLPGPYGLLFPAAGVRGTPEFQIGAEGAGVKREQ